MKVVLAMVMSLDGKTTQHNANDIYHWTSQEDQKHFFSLIKKHNVIVMGRATYDAARPVMKLTPGKLRLVMTRTPEKYSEEKVPGQLEFTDNTPLEIIAELERKNYSELLLAGGASVNMLFLKEKLVDEMWLTIEPRMFGIGNPLVGTEALDINLSLESSEKLNTRGTLLLKYRIQK